MLDRYFKICILIVSSLSVNLISFGQGAFNNYYPAGINNTSYANQVQVNNQDTTYLIYAPWKDITANQGLRLLKIDKSGNVLIDNKFMFGSLIFATYLNNRLSIKTSNFSSLAIGDTYFGSDRGLIFCKINNKLADTIHTKKYCDHTYAYSLGNRFLKRGNQVWYFGNKFNPNDNNYADRPVIFKVDTNGNYIGQTEITSLLKHSPTAVYYDTLLKYIYFGGSNNTIPQTPQSFIACIDTTGNVIWNQQIGNYPFNSVFSQLEKVNNELIICGSYRANGDPTYSKYKLQLLKRNAINGNPVWQKVYGAINYNSLSSIIINGDGSIVTAGTYNDAVMAAQSDGIVLKVGSNGDSLWSKRYGIYGVSIIEMFYDIQKAPDGGYIMCGSPDYLSSCESWVVKTDSLGIAPGLNTGMVEFTHNTEAITMYPNPTSNILNISNGSEENVDIYIYNVNGQLLLKESCKARSENVINTDILINGIYFVNLTNLKSINKTNKLVIVR